MMPPNLRESIKIVAGTVGLSVVYGIAHDLVTAHIEVEYFTKFHPHIIDSESPIAMALLWGVIATWWMGLFVGVALAGSAQVGRLPRLSSKLVLLRTAKCLIAVYVAAMLTLALGLNTIHSVWPIPGLDRNPRFSAVLITHNVSYLLSAAVAFGICLFNWRQRNRMLPPVMINREPPPA